MSNIQIVNLLIMTKYELKMIKFYSEIYYSCIKWVSKYKPC